MLCVGAMGLKNGAHGRIGSTAAAVAASAHCPVAIIQAHDPHRATQRWVVAEVGKSPVDNGVLQCAIEEARLRGAPLRVLTTWQSRYTDIHDGNAVTDGNRLAKAQLEGLLAQWRKRYPDVDMRAVAVHGNTLNYLAKNSGSIQLLVVGHERPPGSRPCRTTRVCAATRRWLFGDDLPTAERIVKSVLGGTPTEGFRW